VVVQDDSDIDLRQKAEKMGLSVEKFTCDFYWGDENVAD